MQLLEHEGMALFRKYRIPTPFGLLAESVDEIIQFYETNGPTVIKAQAPVGGRGKAGLVKVAKNKKDAQKYAKEILGSTLHGMPIKQVWLSTPIETYEEFYLALTFEEKPIVLFGPGGVDAESYRMKKYEFDEENLPDTPFPQEILKQLWILFKQEDATLAEINPLVRTPHGYYAFDSKIIIDDYALFRHTYEPSIHVGDETEREAVKAGLKYVALDGNIGVIANGAGLTMHTLDSLGDLKPANFLDLEGGADQAKVKKALEIVFSNPKVEKVLVNIFAGLTDVEEVVKGILQAKSDIPLFVRISGREEEKALKMLRNAGITAEKDLQKLVEAMK